MSEEELDERSSVLWTKYLTEYRLEVKSDGHRHYVVLTCNGVIIAFVYGDIPPPMWERDLPR